jgi:hypothetical protein
MARRTCCAPRAAGLARGRARATALAAAALLVLAGCATGTGGLVAGEVVEADGARVIVVRGYGLQVRTEPIDAGLTLGYARRTYVYPDTTPGLPAPGSYILWIPQPATAPVALDGAAIGLDLQASRLNLGMTIGYRGTSLLTHVPVGESIFVSLRFAPTDPAATRLRYCGEGEECLEFDVDADGG